MERHAVKIEGRKIVVGVVEVELLEGEEAELLEGEEAEVELANWPESPDPTIGRLRITRFLAGKRRGYFLHWTAETSEHLFIEKLRQSLNLYLRRPERASGQFVPTCPLTDEPTICSGEWPQAEAMAENLLMCKMDLFHDHTDVDLAAAYRIGKEMGRERAEREQRLLEEYAEATRKSIMEDGIKAQQASMSHGIEHLLSVADEPTIVDPPK